MRKNQVSTYKKVAKDFNFEAFPSNMIYKLRNGRLTSSDDANIDGGVVNVKGNELSFEMPQGIYILGHTSIGPEVYMVCTDSLEPEGGAGYIYRLTIDMETLETQLDLIYSNPEFQYSVYHMVQVLGSRENSSTVRLYFSDFNTETRAFNTLTIEEDSPIQYTQLFPDADLPSPVIQDIIDTGGSLAAGIYEIGYLLTTFDGKKSLYSPTSQQVHVIDSAFGPTIEYNDSETVVQDPNSNQFGDNVICQKSISVEVDLSQYPEGLYRFITFVSIFKNQEGQAPTISEIGTVDIPEDQIASYVYTGTETTTTITEEDFYDNRYPFYTNKSFAAKDNYLLVANLKDNLFAVDYDASVFRYKKFSTETYEDVYKNPYNDESGRRFGELSDIDFEQWFSNDQFKYQADSDYLGGSGANIDYRFTLEPMDGPSLNTLSIPLDTQEEEVNGLPSKYAKSFHSPYLRDLRGYKRGEIYRFGIVFFNNKGNSSFVQYIGDIKFPEISERAGYQMQPGIEQFPIIDFPEDPQRQQQYVIPEALPLIWPQDTPVSAGSMTIAVGGTYQLIFNGTLTWENTEILSQHNVTMRIIDDETEEVLATRIMTFSSIYNDFDQAEDGTSPITFYIEEREWTQGQVVRIEFEHNQVGYQPQGSISITDAVLEFDSQDVKFSTFYSLGIEFDVKNMPEGATSYQIVRVPREDFYKTRITQGNGSKTYALTSDDYPDTQAPTGNLTSVVGYFTRFGDGSDDNTHRRYSRRNIIPFFSPEVLYNSLPTDSVKNHFLKVSGTFGVLGYLRGNNAGNPIFSLDENAGTVDQNDSQAKFCKTYPLPGYENNAPLYFEKIKGSKKYGPGSGPRAPIGDSPWRIYNYCWPWNVRGAPLTGNIDRANSGTKLFLDLEKGESNELFNWNYNYGQFGGYNNCKRRTFIYDIIRLQTVHYGGNNKAAVARNIFKPVGPKYYSTGSNRYFDGDIYTYYFEYMYSFWDHYSSGGSFFMDVSFPVETTINLDIAQGSTRARGNTFRFEDDDPTSYGLQESDHNEEGYPYLYDKIYSETKIGKPFFAEPIDFVSVTDYPTRAYRSQPKILGENIDSWSQFFINDFYDIDPQYGPITHIHNFRDEIFTIQEQAFGRYSINPRSVISDNAGLETSLGTATGIQDHGYISTHDGSIHQFSVVSNDMSLYFYNHRHNRILQYNGESLRPLSEELLFNSELLSLTKNMLDSDRPYIDSSVVATYEPTHREVYFTFLGLDRPLPLG